MKRLPLILTVQFVLGFSAVAHAELNIQVEKNVSADGYCEKQVLPKLLEGLRKDRWLNSPEIMKGLDGIVLTIDKDPDLSHYSDYTKPTVLRDGKTYLFGFLWEHDDHMGCGSDSVDSIKNRLLDMLEARARGTGGRNNGSH